MYNIKPFNIQKKRVNWLCVVTVVSMFNVNFYSSRHTQIVLYRMSIWKQSIKTNFV